ncbi:MAG: OsmC family protein [Rikenellaceae bacterium]
MTIKTIYTGGLRTQATHIDSNTTILTDAPKDNQGNGEAFSPTDLLATSLGSCMLTIMGIAARTHGINIDGVETEITKIMSADPRRVAEIVVVFNFPEGVEYSTKERKILEAAAHSCPVSKSLHPELVQNVTFNF